jgi:hypothetical protein
MKKLGKGCLLIVGAVLVLGIIGMLLGGRGSGGTVAQPSGAPTSASVAATTDSESVAQEPTAAPQPTPAPSAHNVGEDVQVDEVRWKVLEAVDLGQTLKSDNQFVKDKTTAGAFVRVRFEIENLSKDMLTFAGLDLVDDQGRAFKPSSDAFQFLPTEEACVLENLNPNVAKTCTAIYEVPANATGMQAQAGDLKLLGGETALINLGLTSQ